MENLELNSNSIYKVSHGRFAKEKAFKDLNSANYFKEKNWIVIHSKTGNGQIEEFKNNLRIGDFVYVCHASLNLSYFAKIVSDYNPIPEEDLKYVKGEKAWVYRKIEPLYEPNSDSTLKLTKENKNWLPSGNSTLWKIPLDELNEFNDKIATPHYNLIIINSSLKTEATDENNHQNGLYMNPKNIILYGPPGTGKTYNSIDKAVLIAIGEDQGGHKKNKEAFDELKRQGQIEFVTFHQNYSYEDFIGGLVPDITATDNLRFKKRDGIFKQISDRAKKNWLAANNKKESIPEFDDVFNSFFNLLIEEEEEEVEIPMRLKGYSFAITSIEVNEGRIKFRKKSGGTGHDLLVRNIRGIYDGTIDYSLDGLGIYYYPLVEKLKEHAFSLKPTDWKKEKLKNYVLIIDEINRANISRVFGELITLLEDDKRLGEPNELTIHLPSIDKEFGIPPNLYIIGTMNTADKSIALVDIALRRRFEFIGYYPKYKNYDNDAAILLKTINDAIFEMKKSADYLIGHAYFMKQQSIEEILRTKVVPLLMEYFSGKTEIVSRIFDETKWSVLYNPSTYSWDIAKR